MKRKSNWLLNRAATARREFAEDTIESFAPCMIGVGSDLCRSAAPSAMRVEFVDEPVESVVGGRRYPARYFTRS